MCVWFVLAAASLQASAACHVCKHTCTLLTSMVRPLPAARQAAGDAAQRAEELAGVARERAAEAAEAAKDKVR